MGATTPSEKPRSSPEDPASKPNSSKKQTNGTARSNDLERTASPAPQQRGNVHHKASTSPQKPPKATDATASQQTPNGERNSAGISTNSPFSSVKLGLETPDESAKSRSQSPQPSRSSGKKSTTSASIGVSGHINTPSSSVSNVGTLGGTNSNPIAPLPTSPFHFDQSNKNNGSVWGRNGFGNNNSTGSVFGSTASGQNSSSSNIFANSDFRPHDSTGSGFGSAGFGQSNSSAAGFGSPGFGQKSSNVGGGFFGSSPSRWNDSNKSNAGGDSSDESL
jgi:hypothetical protein